MSRRGLLIAMFLVASVGVQYWAHSLWGLSRLGSTLPKGATSPAFSLEDLDGKVVNLEDLRGKPVVIDFWATWCGPCREEFKALEAWWKEESSTGILDGVEVLAVNCGEPTEVVRAYVDRVKFPFRVLLDADASVLSAYGVRSIPTLFLIDREGRVVEVHVGYDPVIGGRLTQRLGFMGEE